MKVGLDFNNYRCMITLKSLILNEGERQVDYYKNSTVGIDNDKFNKIKPYFSDIIGKWKEGVRFYRKSLKDKSGYNYYFISPSKIERKSRDIDNLYYVLLDNLPSWREYPKRSKSIIFTNNTDEASNYAGHMFSVFPKNGARIASAKYSNNYLYFSYLQQRIHLNFESIWMGFGYVFRELYKQTKKYADLYELFKDKYAISTSDYKEFIQILNNIVLDEITPMKDSSLVAEDLLKHLKIGHWEEYFDELLNPVNNDVNLYNTNNIPNERGIRELWTDSSIILKRAEDLGGAEYDFKNVDL